MTPAAHAFVELDRAVTAHAGALDRLDRAERRFIAARTAVDGFEARDEHRHQEHGGSAPDGPERSSRSYMQRAPARLHRCGLGSRRRASAVRAARERRLADRVGRATDALHAAPAADLGDLALKLAVTIAAGEAGPPDASTFPWSRLRQVLADIVRLAGAGA